MKTTKLAILAPLLLGVLMLWTTASEAALCTSQSSGNWNVAARWSCNRVPINNDDVTIANGHTVTLNVDSANLGTLTINAGGVLQGDGTGKVLTVGKDGGTDVSNNGTLNLSGTNAATVKLNKTSQWSGTGTWNLSFLNLNTKTLNFAGGTTATINLSGSGDPISNPGAVTSLSTITWNYNGTAAQTTSSSGNVLYGNLTANNAAGLTLALNLTTSNLLGNLSVPSGVFNDGGFSITGLAAMTFTVSNGAIFNITNAAGMVTGFASNTFGATSTVNYALNGAQTVSAETYGHLILSGGGTKTPVAGTTTIAGNFTLAAGVTYAGTTNNPTVNLAGNFSNSGTFNSGTGLFTFNGTAAQTLTGATTFTNMQMNNSNGLTINSNVTVSTLLTLTGGVITTGSNTLITSANCNAPAVSRTSGHIAGNLQKRIPTGAPVSCTFEVGDATTYRPINTTFASVSTAGNVTGWSSQSAGDHPDTTNLLSGVDPLLSVNRYWILTNSGTVFTTCSATFNFVAGDIDAGALYTSFIVALGSSCSGSGATRTCTSWTQPTVGTLGATSTQATGLTAFGDFAIGQARNPNFSREPQFIYTRELY